MDRSVLKWALPVAALLPFAAIGIAQMIRRSPVRRLEGRVPAPGDPGFRECVSALVGSSLRGGSRVEILLNGDELFSRMWGDFEAAKRSIAVHTFFWADGRLASELVRRLSARARAGIEVRVLYDGVGAIGLSDRVFDELREAGGRIEQLRPARPRSWHSVHHRSHARYVLIDDRVAYTGGFGFSDEWLGGGRTRGEWRDTAVRVEGPPARLLISGFRSLWADPSGTLLVDPPSPAEPGIEENGGVGEGGEGMEALAIQSSPTSISSPVERLFALTIAAARQRLHLSIAYFVPNRFFTDLLADAARRGVDVRILTANRRSDVPPAWWAGRSRYERLLDGGVRIWEYQPSMMHAKTWVVDGMWSIIGAANLDNQSLTNLDESMVAVLDRGVGRTMEEHFHDDLRHAREITLDEFRARPLHERALERAASSVARLL